MYAILEIIKILLHIKCKINFIFDVILNNIVLSFTARYRYVHIRYANLRISYNFFYNYFTKEREIIILL